MVALSYEYGLFEKPQEDQEQGLSLAASSCGTWGYTGANPFGESRKCEAANQYGSCIRWEVTQRYQCVGAPSSSNAQAPGVSTPSVERKPDAQPTGTGQVHSI